MDDSCRETAPRELAPDELLLSERRVDGAIVLSIGGEVDLANVPSLRARLQKAAEAPLNLIIELQSLRYIDSCGIKALLDVNRSARDGRQVVLAALSPMVRRTFEIVQVEQVIPVFPTVEAAVESLHNGNGKT